MATLMALAHADTPANCTYQELLGEWTFKIGEMGHDNTLNCSNFGSTFSKCLFYVTSYTCTILPVF